MVIAVYSNPAQLRLRVGQLKTLVMVSKSDLYARNRLHSLIHRYVDRQDLLTT